MIKENLTVTKKENFTASTSNETSSISELEQMFNGILNSKNVFYKSLQKNEEELSRAAKHHILEELFNKKPHVFLERYHSFIIGGNSLSKKLD